MPTIKPCDEDSLADPIFEMAVGETTKAFAAFNDYLEIGPDRTVRQAAIEGGNDYATCRDWSKRWRWTQRASAFDADTAARRRKAYADEYTNVGRRHAQQAQAALEALIRPAIVLLERIRSDPLFLLELEQMKPADLYTLTMQSLRILPHIQAAENVAWGDGVTDSAGAAYLDDIDYDAEHMTLVAATLLEIGAIDPANITDPTETPALTTGDSE